ncbi:hypothetical protein [Pseudosulfitobacter pseudonitzschiae]|uniref:hypothetical protein n=1 Tax=Pseudosulfitobacter pseudonitzschiae TaxID=1402135 RepID=UPI001AFB2A6C|nr:hypothetical protein [Pseudosulfitobacter pseudonitzschiae]MBM1817393.1 hypothetical protein [Pseudosulfitobacter pseudonitzschiae]MBM1834591.1 hypothetical protein [Pseudosulfitobacter pseudonitzschiae]MBM1844306.1 hypothetical protein [Pseudosulfitobacter pseudonitzschiae]MBM1854001.1 hypothetical protein [Pseudosulfitobacter pseudonitzschiae]MBM1858855.1 hypothetical protein [Pseudosulfitobacter pseudonitzschiae]
MDDVQKSRVDHSVAPLLSVLGVGSHGSAHRENYAPCVAKKDETALREWLHTARDLRAESMYSGTQLHHQRKMLSYEFH